jgi:DNA-binding MarR family transcriptional regulator
MDAIAQRELEILASIGEERPLTQRALALRLGIALGLTNLYLKRLVRKGYVKVSTTPASRIKYLLTPRGLAQKGRLTRDYMRRSLALFRELRAILRQALLPLTANGAARVAIYGTGEVAELAYLTLMELGLRPAAVLDGRSGGTFLGHAIAHVREAPCAFDAVIVATLDAPERIARELVGLGVPTAAIICLTNGRPAPGRAARGRVGAE